MADLKQSNVALLDAPPSYEETQRAFVSSSLNPASLRPTLSSSSRSNAFKPIVIPQTTTSLPTAFTSPFTRAYSPSLATHSITPQGFLPFLDGLNSAFIATPTAQIASHIGNFMSNIPLLLPIRWAGLGLSVGTGLISENASMARVRAYLKSANEEMFLPRGLRCKMLKTRNMMLAVGAGSEELDLPPLERVEADGVGGESEDPRMRRIRALGGRVAELTLSGLPAPETSEDWWKRTGLKEAQKRDARVQREIMRDRAERERRFDEGRWRADEEARKYDDELMQIERDRRVEMVKAEKKLSGKKGQDPVERAKIEYDLEKEMRKLDREMEKTLREKTMKVGEVNRDAQQELQRAEKTERKMAQKIYWIVIEKADAVDQAFGVEDDVESLDSK